MALVGGGAGVDKDGLARLVDQPGATCSRLTFEAAGAKMAASVQPPVDARNWLLLSTLVQTWVHPFPCWERVTSTLKSPLKSPFEVSLEVSLCSLPLKSPFEMFTSLFCCQAFLLSGWVISRQKRERLFHGCVLK